MREDRAHKSDAEAVATALGVGTTAVANRVVQRQLHREFPDVDECVLQSVLAQCEWDVTAARGFLRPPLSNGSTARDGGRSRHGNGGGRNGGRSAGSRGVG
jgi:hypothetical protein